MASGDILRLGGGTDFLSGTAFTRNTITTDYDNTILNVTGKGMLVMLYNFDFQQTIAAVIQVDGKPNRIQINSISGTVALPVCIPFKNSIKVTCNSQALQVQYLLL